MPARNMLVDQVFTILVAVAVRRMAVLHRCHADDAIRAPLTAAEDIAWAAAGAALDTADRHLARLGLVLVAGGIVDPALDAVIWQIGQGDYARARERLAALLARTARSVFGRHAGAHAAVARHLKLYPFARVAA